MTQLQASYLSQLRLAQCLHCHFEVTKFLDQGALLAGRKVLLPRIVNII